MYLLALVLGLILAWAIIKRTSNYTKSMSFDINFKSILNPAQYYPLSAEPVMVFPDMKDNLKAPVKATPSLLAKTRVMMPFGPVPTNVTTPSLVDKPVYNFDDLKEARVLALGPPSAQNPNTPIDVQNMFDNTLEF